MDYFRTHLYVECAGAFEQRDCFGRCEYIYIIGFLIGFCGFLLEYIGFAGSIMVLNIRKQLLSNLRII